MKYGKNFKYYREKNGLSQEELANKLHISRQAVSRWENDWNIPDITNLKELCRLYNITLDELLRDTINEENPVDTIQISENLQREEREPTDKRRLLQDTILMCAMLVIGCPLGIFGVFIAGYILYFCCKNKQYSKIMILFCILAIMISLWNTWGYLNTFFFDIGYGSYEKISMLSLYFV